LARKGDAFKVIDSYDNIYKSIENRIGADKAELVSSYLDMVLERNEHINLTAVRDRNEAMVKHVVDSLAILDLPEFKESKIIIDVGTGAGFPGALLAIACPEKEFVLLDSTLKRLKVIDEFSEALNIQNITTLHARAEEINRKPPHGGAYDLCISRAVANLNTLSTWCLPFVKKGGHFISYKGENYGAELDAAASTIKRLGGKFERVEDYIDVPEEIAGHVFLIISK
jgi:16S rRNA (guanine527-N7)-methyltransferase